MIYDVFMFNDEFEMLDCRLQQSSGLVDKTIAIEGNRTMSGQPKPYHLYEAWREGRYKDLLIARVDLDDVSKVELPQLNYVTPETEDHWRRDLKQRSGADPFLWDLGSDNIIITGDVDEVPQYDLALDVFDGSDTVLAMTWLVYSSRWRVAGMNWLGTNISTAGSIRGKDAGAVRRSRVTRQTQVPSGWHLSWFGTPDDRWEKIHQFAHGEMVKEAQDAAFHRFGQRLTPDGKRRIIPFDGVLPEYIADGSAPGEWLA